MQSNYAYISLHGLMLSTQADNQKTASVLRILLSVSALIWPLTTQSAVGAELPNAQRTHTDRSHWLTLDGNPGPGSRPWTVSFAPMAKGATSYWHCGRCSAQKHACRGAPLTNPTRPRSPWVMSYRKAGPIWVMTIRRFPAATRIPLMSCSFMHAPTICPA